MCSTHDQAETACAPSSAWGTMSECIMPMARKVIQPVSCRSGSLLVWSSRCIHYGPEYCCRWRLQCYGHVLACGMTSYAPAFAVLLILYLAVTAAAASAVVSIPFNQLGCQSQRHDAPYHPKPYIYIAARVLHQHDNTSTSAPDSASRGTVTLKSVGVLTYDFSPVPASLLACIS